MTYIFKFIDLLGFDIPITQVTNSTVSLTDNYAFCLLSLNRFSPMGYRYFPMLKSQVRVVSLLDKTAIKWILSQIYWLCQALKSRKIFKEKKEHKIIKSDHFYSVHKSMCKQINPLKYVWQADREVLLQGTRQNQWLKDLIRWGI